MLAGNLREFGLPDIFQLLAQTKKSGALRVDAGAASATGDAHTGGSAQGRVFFRTGEVFFAVSDTRRMPLGARLVSAGLLSEEQLPQVLSAQRDAGIGRFGQVLIDSGVVDEATLDFYVRQQIEDAVFDLMRLADGSFAFDQFDPSEGPVGLTLATDHLIAEGQRRLEQWQAIGSAVGSLDAVVAIAPVPSAGLENVAIGLEDWKLLSLIDGRRTVRDLVELTGQGEFVTCQVLGRLVQAGLVESVDPTGGLTAVAGLVARRDALRRLEEAELGAPAAPRAAAPAPASPAAPSFAPAPPPRPAPTAPAQARVALPEPAALPPVEAPVPVGAAAANGAGAKGQSVDRAQVVRELAALGLNQTAQTMAASDDQAATTAPAPEPQRPAEPVKRLTRDEDVNKGLLLRLIDGVKGA